MRSARLLLRLIVAGSTVALAACSSGATAGWTYAPPPSATPVSSAPASAGSSAAPSAAPSPNPGASGSAAPSSAASGSPAAGGSPAASGPTGGTVLKLEANGVQYVETTLQAPANQPFQIDFNNQDAGIPHNVQIKDSTGNLVFNGDRVDGPKEVTYSVPALPAGAYKFNCLFHPNMVGDLTVQ